MFDWKRIKLIAAREIRTRVATKSYRISLLVQVLIVALLALTFAWGVEFSQLYRAPWLDAVRATIPGKLVFGNTFAWPDLVAYAVGIALGALAEWRSPTG